MNHFSRRALCSMLLCLLAFSVSADSKFDDATLKNYLEARDYWYLRLSPDGRHVAYASNDTGQLEVYVRDFPGGGRRWQVSVGGGRMPRWNPDDDEMLYSAADNRLLAVPFERRAGGDDLEFGVAEALFTVAVKSHRYLQWDLLDGRRMLFNTEVRGGATDPLTLVQGWQLPGPP